MTRRVGMAGRESRQQRKIRNEESQLDMLGSFRCGYFTSFTGIVNTKGNRDGWQVCALGDGCRLIATRHNIQLPDLQVRVQIELGSPKRGTTKGPIVMAENIWIGD